jgi:hypothetical protein
VEIEVWPPKAEVYFLDEQHIDPVNTQVRFDAVVYNTPSAAVRWEVIGIDGGAAAGAIDSSGLYMAPPKGSLPHATTDIVIASAADDPLRKAFAWVTLVGFGPEVEPQPKLEIYPQQTYLYYPEGMHNSYIDPSNTMQVFRAMIHNSGAEELEWFVDEGGGYGSPVGDLNPWYAYQVSGSGNNKKKVKIKARLKDDLNVMDEAIVYLINYFWPGVT